MLFWGGYKEASNCRICMTFGWQSNDICANNDANYSTMPAKVLWRFPFTPTLQMLFMCEETATAMRWYAINRPNNGNLRHLANAKT